MNEGLLVYLWVLYGNLSEFVVVLFVVGVVAYGVSLFATLVSGMIHTIYAKSEDEVIKNVGSYHKKDAIAFYGYWVKAKKYIKFLVVLAIVMIFFPTRNQAILIFSAPTIVDVAKDGWDSDTSNKLGNILDNSLDYLESKTKELKENK